MSPNLEQAFWGFEDTTYLWRVGAPGTALGWAILRWLQLVERAIRGNGAKPGDEE